YVAQHRQERDTAIDLIGWWDSSITDQLLSWKVAENNQPVAVKFVSRNFRPDKIVEVDSVGDVRLTASIAYLGATPCISDLSPKLVRIAPQSKATFTIAMGFGR